MNTSGVTRAYMSKNMIAEEFIGVVTKALSREFEEEVILVENNNGFKISMKNYKIIVSKEFIEEIQSPYSIDRYVLEEFRKQGFDFDRNRSQYIRYCYGHYNNEKSTMIY